MAADEWVHDDRIHGAILGLVIGDALGALRHQGQSWPRDLAPGSLKTGGATQLGLFTAAGLISMYARLAEKGIGPAWGVIRHGLDRWMVTQGRTPHPIFGPPGEGWPDGWLVLQHPLHRRVDGFDATVPALSSRIDPSEGLVERHVPASVPNTSTGAGALVRVAGAGLIARPQDAFLVGAVASAYTHGGADGYLSGAALARIVAGLVAGDQAGDVLDAARAELASWPGGETVRTVMGGGLAPRPTSSGARALAIGVECLHPRSPLAPIPAIESSLAKGGTAAGVVTGVLVGAGFGRSAFPSGWIAAPDVTSVLEEIGRAMSCAHRAWAMGRELPGYGGDPISAGPQPPTDSELFWPRFPGW